MSDAPPLPSSPEMADGLARLLPGWAIEWVDETGSTNTDLVGEVRAGEPLPRLRGAHLQVAGRGRADRKFRTGAGDALMFSCAFDNALPVASLPTLSVLFGLAACEALVARLGSEHQLGLKWPNDLLWDDAKLAGILMETAQTRPGRPPGVVVGMGLNLRGGAALTEALGRDVADWSATGSSESPVVLCAAVALAWHDALRHAEANVRPGAGLSDLPRRFARHDALAGRSVAVRDQRTVIFDGIADGIASDGRLRVGTALGERLISVGDISVRAHPGGMP